MSLKAAYYTLGCKLNFSETSTIGRMLSERGVERAAARETPDIVVINTCSVTETADKKGRSLIRRVTRRWPEATVVVTGCYAQLKPAEIAEIPGVDIVLGSNEKLRILEFLDAWTSTRVQSVHTTPARDITDFQPSCERGDRTRFFLKVQDGCDCFCTYCTIPYARGRSRSGRIADIVALARDAAARGGREIVITGVNIGDFGRDTGEKLLDLFRALDAVEGIDRYRISSIEPDLLTDEIIEWIARDSRAFMPSFHIPLQSGSDRVLKLMNRRYDTALFASRIAQIRRLIPDAFIGVDVIAGARGETPEEWQKSYDFIASLDVQHLHVFPYSERPGTAALALGNPVDQAEKHRRAETLIALSAQRHADFLKKHHGATGEVLWEHSLRGSGMMHGFTRNYIRVEAPFDPEMVNTLSEVTLTPDNITEQQ